VGERTHGQGQEPKPLEQNTMERQGEEVGVGDGGSKRRKPLHYVPNLGRCMGSGRDRRTFSHGTSATTTSSPPTYSHATMGP
jgi:hypothetical protein